MTTPWSSWRSGSHHVERRLPTKGQIERAVALVKSRSRPLVICGGGVRYSEAGRELSDFCAAFGVPMGETQAGKGVISWEEPFNLGGVGVTGGLAANRIAHEADLVIAVGTRLGDFTTGSRNLFKNPSSVILTINVSSFDAAKMNATTVGSRRPGKPEGADAGVALCRVESRLERRGGKDPRGVAKGRGQAVLGGRSGRALPGEAPRRAEREAPAGTPSWWGLRELPGDLQRVWRSRAAGLLPYGIRLFLHGVRDSRGVGARMAAPSSGGVCPGR